MPDKQNRVFLGRDTAKVPALDLKLIPRTSYNWFLDEGVTELLQEFSPIEDFTGENWRLVFGDHVVGEARYEPMEALQKGVTFEAPLKVQTQLINKQTNETVEQEVFLGYLPLMTDNGTFIVNGIERAVVNQLVRAPGVYFFGELDVNSGKTNHMAELRPLRGSWLEFSIDKNNTITVRIDRRRKFPVTTLLRAIGLGDNDEMLKAFAGVDTNDEAHFIANTLTKDVTATQDEAILEIYRRMRPGEPVVIENAKEFLDSMFFNPRRYTLTKVGRYKINKKLGLKLENKPENWVLQNQDLIGTISYLINLQNGVSGKVDDIDHLANRRVRLVGELVQQNALRVGLARLERVVRDRMSLSATELKVTPSQLINARPIIAAINDFFRSNQLSSILDQTNPLSETDNLRRLSVMGTGGITRERASFSIRDINHSQYGKIDPIRSPEGPNIGLVTYIALYARINEYGFLESPYRKVTKDKNGKLKVTNDVVYLDAEDEENYYITHLGVNMDDKNIILDKQVGVRYQGDFFTAPASLVQYMDYMPNQIVGTSASLIPFLSHDEANRALMGTNMQCQAVPLIRPQSPIVGTGMEQIIADNLGRVVRATGNGKVTYVDANKVQVKYAKETKEYKMMKFYRPPASTCYTQRPTVTMGQAVKPGDLLVDGPAVQGGELALGQNLTIAYMSYEGLGYEDALVISERIVKDDRLTSIHIEEYETAVVDTKLGPEEITRDIPNVSEETLNKLDAQGIVYVGVEVGPNDILVGKIAPKGETELTAEERLLRAIFGEKAREVRDTSLRMPHGEHGTVIDVRIFSPENGDELETGVNKLIKVKVAQMRKITVGDKLAGRHGNKGIISKIIPEEDMPYLPDGTPVDIIISPRSVLARMNLGQLLEAHLGWACEKLGKKISLPVFEELPEGVINQYLKEAGYQANGKTKLFDGKTGMPFDNEIVVGKSYIMKLSHMVEDKQHARSTGPYSLVTQQPLGGKAQMGGQRLGEMEVWALEAYGAAYTLQEMLTIKSDDVIGRAKAFEAIVKGTDIPQALIPESFKVLVSELKALCLDVQMLGVQEGKTEDVAPDEEKVEAQAEEFARELGATTVAESDEIAAGGMEVEDVGEAATEATSGSEEGTPEVAASDIPVEEGAQ